MPDREWFNKFSPQMTTNRVSKRPINGKDGTTSPIAG